MITIISKSKSTVLYKAWCLCVAFTFVVSMLVPPVYAQNAFSLPAPGTMIMPTPQYLPVIIRGIRIDPVKPFDFDFILDNGDDEIAQDDLKEESTKLIKYFLASLTIPEEDLWVNLSPYEKNRIIPQEFGQTEMGRDLLTQDYLLKQLTASLIYPEKEIGQKFWDRVYKKAHDRFGTTQIPINTFNKVWILPDKVDIYENGNTAFIVKSRLKVMLEADYVALQHEMRNAESRGKRGISSEDRGLDELAKEDARDINDLSSDIVRDILIPEIEKEVNTGENFAPLRQIYNSLILATWYKTRLKEGVLNKIYSNQNMIDGVDVEDKNVKDKIYAQYMEAFKKGVYNYIKEDYDEYSQEVMPRKYFSGGVVMTPQHFALNPAVVSYSSTPDAALQSLAPRQNHLFEAQGYFEDQAIEAVASISEVLPEAEAQQLSKELVASGNVAVRTAKGEPFIFRYTYQEQDDRDEDFMRIALRSGKETVGHVDIKVNQEEKTALMDTGFAPFPPSPYGDLSEAQLKEQDLHAIVTLEGYPTGNSRGIGRSLMGVAMRILKQGGIKSFEAKQVESAAGFYDKIGFTEVDSNRKEFWFDLEQDLTSFPQLKIDEAMEGELLPREETDRLLAQYPHLKDGSTKDDDVFVDYRTEEKRYLLVVPEGGHIMEINQTIYRNHPNRYVDGLWADRNYWQVLEEETRPEYPRIKSQPSFNKDEEITHQRNQELEVDIRSTIRIRLRPDWVDEDSDLDRLTSVEIIKVEDEYKLMIAFELIPDITINEGEKIVLDNSIPGQIVPIVGAEAELRLTTAGVMITREGDRFKIIHNMLRPIIVGDQAIEAGAVQSNSFIRHQDHGLLYIVKIGSEVVRAYSQRTGEVLNLSVSEINNDSKRDKVTNTVGVVQWDEDIAPQTLRTYYEHIRDTFIADEHDTDEVGAFLTQKERGALYRILEEMKRAIEKIEGKRYDRSKLDEAPSFIVGLKEWFRKIKGSRGQDSRVFKLPRIILNRAQERQQRFGTEAQTLKDLPAFALRVANKAISLHSRYEANILNEKTFEEVRRAFGLNVEGATFNESIVTIIEIDLLQGKVGEKLGQEDVPRAIEILREEANKRPTLPSLESLKPKEITKKDFNERSLEILRELKEQMGNIRFAGKGEKGLALRWATRRLGDAENLEELIKVFEDNDYTITTMAMGRTGILRIGIGAGAGKETKIVKERRFSWLADRLKILRRRDLPTEEESIKTYALERIKQINQIWRDLGHKDAAKLDGDTLLSDSRTGLVVTGAENQTISMSLKKYEHSEEQRQTLTRLYRELGYPVVDQAIEAGKLDSNTVMIIRLRDNPYIQRALTVGSSQQTKVHMHQLERLVNRDDSEFKKEIFDFIDRFEDDLVLSQAEDFLNSIPSEENNWRGIGDQLHTTSEYDGKKVSLRHLFLHPTRGSIDLMQIMTPILQIAPMIEQMQKRPEDDQTRLRAESYVEGGYLLLRAYEIISRDSKMVLIRKRDVGNNGDLYKYLMSKEEDRRRPEEAKNLLGLSDLLVELGAVRTPQKRESLNNLIGLVERLKEDDGDWREIFDRDPFSSQIETLRNVPDAAMTAQAPSPMARVSASGQQWINVLEKRMAVLGALSPRERTKYEKRDLREAIYILLGQTLPDRVDHDDLRIARRNSLAGTDYVAIGNYLRANWEKYGLEQHLGQWNQFVPSLLNVAYEQYIDYLDRYIDKIDFLTRGDPQLNAEVFMGVSIRLVRHMARLGSHAERKGLRQDGSIYIPDAEVLTKVMKALLPKIAKLHRTGLWTQKIEPEEGADGLDVTYEDLMLWGLLYSINPIVHNYFLDPSGQVDARAEYRRRFPGGPEEMMTYYVNEMLRTTSIGERYLESLLIKGFNRFLNEKPNTLRSPFALEFQKGYYLYSTSTNLTKYKKGPLSLSNHMFMPMVSRELLPKLVRPTESEAREISMPGAAKYQYGEADGLVPYLLFTRGPLRNRFRGLAKVIETYLAKNDPDGRFIKEYKRMIEDQALEAVGIDLSGYSDVKRVGDESEFSLLYRANVKRNGKTDVHYIKVASDEEDSDALIRRETKIYQKIHSDDRFKIIRSKVPQYVGSGEITEDDLDVIGERLKMTSTIKGNPYLIVSENSNPPLTHFIEKIGEQENPDEAAIKVINLLVDLVADFHEVGIAHGDVHSDQLLLDLEQNELGILDFGLATIKGDKDVDYNQLANSGLAMPGNMYSGWGEGSNRDHRDIASVLGIIEEVLNKTEEIYFLDRKSHSTLIKLFQKRINFREASADLTTFSQKGMTIKGVRKIVKQVTKDFSDQAIEGENYQEFDSRDVLVSQLPNKVEEFLQSRTVPDEIEGLIAAIGGVLQDYPQSGWDDLEDDQKREVAQQIKEIQGRSIGNKKKQAAVVAEVTGLTLDGFPKAQKAVYGLTRVDGAKAVSQKADVIGIFDKHMLRDGFSKVEPTLEKIVETANEQGRKVTVIVEEEAGVTQYGQALIAPSNDNKDLRQWIEKQPDRAFKQINREHAEKIRDRRLVDGPAGDPLSAYREGLQRFLNANQNVRVEAELGSFQGWRNGLNAMKALAASLSINVQEEYLEHIEDVIKHMAEAYRHRDTAVAQQIKKLAESDPNQVIVVVRGAIHHGLVDKLDEKKYRTFKTVVASGQSLMLTDNPWVGPLYELYSTGNLTLDEATKEHIFKLRRFMYEMTPVYQNLNQTVDQLEESTTNIIRAGTSSEFAEQVAQQTPTLVPHIAIRGNDQAIEGEDDPFSEDLGGIDFNPANIDMNIRREGPDIPLPLDAQNLENIKIKGLIPVIINITPVTNIPLILGEMDRPQGDPFARSDYNPQPLREVEMVLLK